MQSGETHLRVRSLPIGDVEVFVGSFGIFMSTARDTTQTFLCCQRRCAYCNMGIIVNDEALERFDCKFKRVFSICH